MPLYIQAYQLIIILISLMTSYHLFGQETINLLNNFLYAWDLSFWIL